MRPVAGFAIDPQTGNLRLFADSVPKPRHPPEFTWRIWVPRPADVSAGEDPRRTYKREIMITLIRSSSNPYEYVVPYGQLRNGQEYCIDLAASAPGYQSSATDCQFDDPATRDAVITYNWVPPTTAPGTPTTKPGGSPGNSGGAPGTTPTPTTTKPGSGSPVVNNPTPPAGGGATGRIPTFFSPIRPQVAEFAVGTKPLPTIQWLWRPEWFRPSPAEKVAQGDSPAQANQKVALEVDPDGGTPKGASAIPWLAGLGAFGVAGFGLMGTRRWRSRSLTG